MAAVAIAHTGPAAYDAAATARETRLDPCDFGSWRTLAQVEDLAQNHTVSVASTAEAVDLARLASDHFAAPAYISCADRWTVTMHPGVEYLARVIPTAAVALKARLVAEMIDAGCSAAEADARVADLASGIAR